MNKVLIVGRLVRNPDIHTTNSGVKYARFTIAVDRPFVSASNAQNADFIPVVAWRNQVDFIEKYLSKGSLVAVEGRLSSNTYVNAENKNVTSYDVHADRVSGLESKAQAESRAQLQTQQIKTPLQFAKEEVPSEIANEEDNQDIPWELDL